MKILASAFITLLAPTLAYSADFVGRVNLVVPCNDDWFEVSMVNVRASWNGVSTPVRFMFKRNVIGTEK